MEIRSRDILIVAVIVVAFFSFWPTKESRSVKEPVQPQNETVTSIPQEEAVEDMQALESDESLNKPLQPKPDNVTLTAPQQPSNQDVKYPNLDDSFAAFDAQGHRFIEQVNRVGKHLVYHGDVLVGDVSDLPKLLKNKVIKVGPSRKWPGGKIPFVIDDSVVQQDKVIDAVEYLNTFTNLTISPRDGEKDYVLVTRGEADCYSYAGRVGGQQEIFLVPECGVKEILHEWMHTIGFFHEQNRGDRDQYLQIIWDNIDEVNKPQFKKLPNDYMGVAGRPFDFQSIMLYPSETFSMHPGEPALLTIDGDIIPRTENLLSDEDIARINQTYPNP